MYKKTPTLNNSIGVSIIIGTVPPEVSLKFSCLGFSPDLVGISCESTVGSRANHLHI